MATNQNSQPSWAVDLRRGFSAHLADQAGVTATDAVVFMKYEGPNFGPCKSYPSREDFINGTNATDHGWITVAAVKRIAKMNGAKIILF